MVGTPVHDDDNVPQAETSAMEIMAKTLNDLIERQKMQDQVLEEILLKNQQLEQQLVDTQSSVPPPPSVPPSPKP